MHDSSAQVIKLVYFRAVTSRSRVKVGYLYILKLSPPSTVGVEVDNETVEADNGVVHVTTRRMQGGHRLARTGKRHFSDKRNGEGKEQEVITPRA